MVLLGVPLNMRTHSFHKYSTQITYDQHSLQVCKESCGGHTMNNFLKYQLKGVSPDELRLADIIPTFKKEVNLKKGND